MVRTLTTLCLAAGILSSGCYLGRSPGAKTVAYVANGALVVGGTAVIADGRGAGDEQALITTIGLLPLLVGVAGIAINVAVETEKAPEPMPLPKSAQLVLRSEK